MLGDATLFARRDEVRAAWEWVDPLIAEAVHKSEPELYPAGSWGPAGAERLITHDGRAWRRP